MKKRDAEQRIIDTARLVLLGWLGDTIDGGQAMREAIGELRAAFEALDAKPVQNGWGPPKPCRWCGKLRSTCKNGSLRMVTCTAPEAPRSNPIGVAWCEAIQ